MHSKDKKNVVLSLRDISDDEKLAEEHKAGRSVRTHALVLALQNSL